MRFCASRADSNKFLFQIGSIKSAPDADVTGKFGKFLFQIGSIKSIRITTSQISNTRVSIPNWFD